MCDKFRIKPVHYEAPDLSSMISWRLMRKNPSGALIWAIFGGSLIMNGYFFQHFLRRKEYQFDHKKRMWNERLEQLKNPVRMKLYYPSEESVPKPHRPLVEVYTKMKEAELRKNKCK
ncbi:uncharacterized protein LOC126842156 [Adelges cooleyi]|uniref:uncharacterized protein LOC126842156 n=1 Tax=Adelges cooleyi TaxID=133065 RepID=UPI00217F85B7|nr:uncharacterized protein LOC126842156 [Adelges cooleyi]